MDAAPFHQVLSNAALNLASLQSRMHTPETRESMEHHTKAVNLVARRIAEKDAATSDAVVAAITAFACYSVSSSSLVSTVTGLTRSSSMLLGTKLAGICT